MRGNLCTDWQAFALIGLQGVRIRQPGETGPQSHGVSRRLRHTHGRVRTNNESRIAKQRQSAMCHARRLIVEDRLHEWLTLGGDRSGKRRRQQARRILDEGLTAAIRQLAWCQRMGVDTPLRVRQGERYRSKTDTTERM